VGCAADTIRRTALRDAEFAEQLDQAEAKAEVLYLQNLRTAAREPRYWRAAAWFLERRHPQQFGPRKPRTVTHEQFQGAIEQFAKIVADEVKDAGDRQRTMSRLVTIVAELVKFADM